MEEKTSDATGPGGTVVGLRPWLPWPLSRSPWWAAPVPAQRLAALRIGLGLVLLLDVLLTYAPYAHDFYGRGSLGAPPLFGWRFSEGKAEALKTDLEHLPEDSRAREPFKRSLALRWHWSLLQDVEDPALIRLAVLAWAGSAACLMLGIGSRLSAAVAWALSISFTNINCYIDNAGDGVRIISLFYLILAPCGAAWSVDAWLWRRLGWRKGPVFVWPWALRLLFVQMVFIYWCNGLYKATGADWHNGDSLYYVLGDLTLTRVSYAQFPVPYLVTKLLTWAVLVWEAAFPLLVAQGDRLDRLGKVWSQVALFLLSQAAAFGVCAALALSWAGAGALPSLGQVAAAAFGLGLLVQLLVAALFAVRRRLGVLGTQLGLLGLSFAVAGLVCLAAAWYFGKSVAEEPLPFAGTVLASGIGLYLAVGVVGGLWQFPVIALCFGAAFHIGIGLSMELGGFVPYMLCLYLPLLPWERLPARLHHLRRTPAPVEGPLAV
ncbi:MAG TPA: hypothetical protein VFA26_09115 [Gemmataceae bacterium]|nr:hypothetical protein [Gemmataceae bacterium]